MMSTEHKHYFNERLAERALVRAQNWDQFQCAAERMLEAHEESLAEEIYAEHGGEG
jgi:hypothetical protein